MVPGRRVLWADTGKGICMLLIILHHVCAYYADDVFFLYQYYPFYTNFFFFISGYFFYKWEEIRPFSLRKKIAYIFRRLLIPYFLYSSVIWLPKQIAHGNEIDLKYYLIDIFGGYANWFVPALIVAYLILSLIIYLSFTEDKKQNKIKLLFIASCAFLSYSIIRITMPDNKLPWHFDRALLGLFYMALGVVMNSSQRLVSKIPVWLLLVSIISYIFTLFFFYNIGISDSIIIYLIYGLIGSYITLQICLRIEGFSFIRFVGKNSLLYYFINTPILSVIIILFHKIGVFYNGYGYELAILYILLILIIYPIAKLINRYFSFTLGEGELILSWTNKLFRIQESK